MNNLKIKLNKRNIETTQKFICSKFGNIDDYVELNPFNFPFRVYIIKPTNDKPYYTLVTLGLQLLKFSQHPKNLEGIELFVRLPNSWTYNKVIDLADGWIWNVFLGISKSMLKGELIVPGSTYQFSTLCENTKQNCVIVQYSNNLKEEDCIIDIETKQLFSVKKTSILFLEIQTLYEEERSSIIQGNAELCNRIFSLPFVDLKRESMLNGK